MWAILYWWERSGGGASGDHLQWWDSLSDVGQAALLAAYNIRGARGQL